MIKKTGKVMGIIGGVILVLVMLRIIFKVKKNIL